MKKDGIQTRKRKPKSSGASSKESKGKHGGYSEGRSKGHHQSQHAQQQVADLYTIGKSL